MIIHSLSLSLSLSNDYYLSTSGSAFTPVSSTTTAVNTSVSNTGSLAEIIQVLTKQLHKFTLSFDIWYATTQTVH